MRKKATFTLLQSSLQAVAGECWRNLSQWEKYGEGSTMSENSLLEQVTAAADERQLSVRQG
jgi:hypothetical protein